MEKFKAVEEIFAVTVKHTMSKAINNTICLDLLSFENCPIAKMPSGKH